MGPYVAVTDGRWFRHLSHRAIDGRVAEVNFWSPSATRPLNQALVPGDPVFFRMKSPDDSVAGYGFFAQFSVLSLDEAWRTFGEGNGDEFEAGFLQRIGGFRGLDLLDPRTPQAPLGCTMLRDARFWPRERWLPWGPAQGWHPNTQRGQAVSAPAAAEALLATILQDGHYRDVVAELTSGFALVEGDHRRVREANCPVREGQGIFRERLLAAYGRACAITGEHTEPVLAAAHIQPYRGPPSNHVQNGVLLTQEFHTLFDLGLVGITPEYEVRVSNALQGRWSNGRRYQGYAGKSLSLPSDPGLRPSPVALDWHQRNVFVVSSSRSPEARIASRRRREAGPAECRRARRAGARPASSVRRGCRRRSRHRRRPGPRGPAPR